MHAHCGSVYNKAKISSLQRMCFRAAATVCRFSNVTLVSRLVLHSQTKFSVQRGLICLFFARQPPVGQGLLIHEVSRSHSTSHHSRQDSSGRVISPSQRPSPDNTQHSQQTDIYAPTGFEPTISASVRLQTHALDSADTENGTLGLHCINIGPPLLGYCKGEASFSVYSYFLYCRNIAGRWPKLAAETCRL